MSLQIADLKRCKVTLVAFVRFDSRVSFQMPPQIACLNRCIVASVAFVRFFSRANFQIRPQIACLNGCIVAFRGSVHHSNKLLTELFCVIVVEFWRFQLLLFPLTMTRFEILPKFPSQSIKKQGVDSFVSCYKLSTALIAQGPSLSLWTQNILLYTFCQTTFSQPSSQFSLNSSPSSTTATPPPPLAPLYIFGIVVLLLLCPYPINLLVKLPCFVNENKAESTWNDYISTSNSGSIAVSLRILYMGWIIH